ncbi:hypothetical protein ABZ733_01895 [Streptomyces longwoodensis]|uniref:hypothetical protein n=1 Tax=Streptomyces longwoodensis TaxID=68231 RepID=UPI003403DCF9
MLSSSPWTTWRNGVSAGARRSSWSPEIGPVPGHQGAAAAGVRRCDERAQLEREQREEHHQEPAARGARRRPA